VREKNKRAIAGIAGFLFFHGTAEVLAGDGVEPTRRELKRKSFLRSLSDSFGLDAR
jgi:hypothetical protein